MRTIKCVGYPGYECGKEVETSSSRRKRCLDCAPLAHRAQALLIYKNNPRAWVPRYEKRKKSGRIHEGNWKSRGIIMKDGTALTYKQFKQDAKKGCMFKGFGPCSGKMCADHDHDTGFYRGVLCFRHNMALGMLGDSLDNLKKVSSILESKI